MKLVYTPEGEPAQSWTFNPNKIRASQAEILEKRSGMPWNDFVQALQMGAVKARKVLLWFFLQQTHVTLRLEDVDFALGELTLEFDREEWARIRKGIEEAKLPEGTPEELRETMLAQIDREAANAEEGEGKANANATG